MEEQEETAQEQKTSEMKLREKDLGWRSRGVEEKDYKEQINAETRRKAVWNDT